MQKIFQASDRTRYDLIVSLQHHLRSTCNVLKRECRLWKECSSSGAGTAASLSNALLQLRDLEQLDLGVLASDKTTKVLLQRKLQGRIRHLSNVLQKFVLALAASAAQLRESVESFASACSAVGKQEKCHCTPWVTLCSSLHAIEAMYGKEMQVKEGVLLGLLQVSARKDENDREASQEEDRSSLEKILQVYMTAWKQEARIQVGQVAATLQVCEVELVTS
jgi:hypothetical protein